VKKIILYTLLFIGANILLFFLFLFIGDNFIRNKRDMDFSGLFFVLISFVISLIVELAVGAILATRARTMEIGKGLLLSAAIVLLFGLSVCSSMW
jgi:hypothetical protein